MKDYEEEDYTDVEHFTFSLTSVEIQRVRDFQSMCEKVIKKKVALGKVKSESLEFNYIFGMTGLGTVCEIECTTLDLRIDITDYAGW